MLETEHWHIWASSETHGQVTRQGRTRPASALDDHARSSTLFRLPRGLYDRIGLHLAQPRRSDSTSTRGPPHVLDNCNFPANSGLSRMLTPPLERTPKVTIARIGWVNDALRAMILAHIMRTRTVSR
jgi:hypothetical protein